MSLMIAAAMLAVSGAAKAEPIFLECPLGKDGHTMRVKIDEERGVVEFLGSRSRAIFGPDFVTWSDWRINRKTLVIQVLSRTGDGFVGSEICKIMDVNENRI